MLIYLAMLCFSLSYVLFSLDCIVYEVSSFDEIFSRLYRQGLNNDGSLIANIFCCFVMMLVECGDFIVCQVWE